MYIGTEPEIQANTDCSLLMYLCWVGFKIAFGHCQPLAFWTYRKMRKISVHKYIFVRQYLAVQGCEISLKSHGKCIMFLTLRKIKKDCILHTFYCTFN